MENSELLAKKQEELQVINKKINEGLKPSFLQIFIKPFGMGIFGFILALILNFSDSQKIGVVFVFYFLSLFFFTIRDKKKIEKERLIAKRLEIQKEIVKLMREVKNERS